MRNGSPWSSRCLILLARPLRPPREPLPDIEEHEVRLVTWMAVNGTRTEASAAAVSWLFSRWPQWPTEPRALHSCGARSGVSPRSRCGAASPARGLGSVGGRGNGRVVRYGGERPGLLPGNDRQRRRTTDRSLGSSKGGRHRRTARESQIQVDECAAHRPRVAVPKGDHHGPRSAEKAGGDKAERCRAGLEAS